MVSGNGCDKIANDDNVRLVYDGITALFSSIKLEIISDKTIDYTDHCHPTLLMYKLLTITTD